MKLRLPKALCSALTLAATALCFAAPSASALEVTTSGGDFTLTQTQLKAGAGDYGDGGYAYSLTAANDNGIVSLTLTGSTLKDASTSFTVNVNGVGTAISSKVDLLTREIAAGVSAIYQIRTKEDNDEDLGFTKTTRLFGTETDASQPSATGYMSFSNLNLLVDFTSGQGVTATSNFLSTPLTAGSTVVSNLSNTIVLNTNYINSITFTVPETTVVSYGDSKTSIYKIVEQNTLLASGVAAGTNAVVLTERTYTLSSPTSIGSLADRDVYIGGTAQLTLNSTAGSAYQNGGTGSIILDESTREDNTSLVLSASSSSNSYLYLGDIKLVTGSTTIQINDGEAGHVKLMGTLGGTRSGEVDDTNYGKGNITIKGGTNDLQTHGLTVGDDGKIDSESLKLQNAIVYLYGAGSASAKAGAVQVSMNGATTAELANVTMDNDGLSSTTDYNGSVKNAVVTVTGTAGVTGVSIEDSSVTLGAGNVTDSTVSGSAISLGGGTISNSTVSNNSTIAYTADSTIGTNTKLDNTIIQLNNSAKLTITDAVITGTTHVEAAQQSALSALSDGGEPTNNGVVLKDSTVILSNNQNSITGYSNNTTSVTVNGNTYTAVTVDATILQNYASVSNVKLELDWSFINELQRIYAEKQIRFDAIVLRFGNSVISGDVGQDVVEGSNFSSIEGAIKNSIYAPLSVTYTENPGEILIAASAFIPEPATATLSLLALAALAARRRRKG